MRVFRAIVWAEDVYPDRDPRAEPDALRVTRSQEMEFISATAQADAVKEFKVSLGKLAAINAFKC